jgi:phosphohistidine phosphatase
VRAYLVRHGTAAPGADDRTRPLTPEGRREIEAIAGVLAARGVEVAEIRHSGLVRARETAAILGERLRPRRGVQAGPGLLPEDDPAVAAAELALAGEPILLVGHLPHLARLVVTLAGDATGEPIQFAPGTAVGLRRDADGWRVEMVLPVPAGSAG